MTTEVVQASTAPMRVTHAVVSPVILRWLRCTITHPERVPAEGPAILAANHTSFLDHFVLGSASPRPMRFVGKASLAEGLGGKFNMALGMIPIERGAADSDAMDVMIAALRAGAIGGIFPEGTRSPTGELYRFRSGMARVAAASGAPIIPVGMTGMAEVWPRTERLPSKRRPRRGVVGVHFGTAVTIAEDSPRARREATAAVYEQVAALCGQPKAAGFAPIPAS